jgi:hypothetical protein
MAVAGRARRESRASGELRPELDASPLSVRVKLVTGPNCVRMVDTGSL